MSEHQESASRAYSSPLKPSPPPVTGIRSPTRLYDLRKYKLLREVHEIPETKRYKKRRLDAKEGALKSTNKCLKSSQLQSINSQTVKADTSDAIVTEDAIEEMEREEDKLMSTEDELHRQVEVARCLEEDLLRDNARMRLKIFSLRDDVDLYYGLLAKMELMASETRQEDACESTKELNSSTRLAEQLQRIICASKPVNEDVAAIAIQ